MSDPSEEIMGLVVKAKELSTYIATLKRRKNRIKDKLEKDRLTDEIKMRQYQALFRKDGNLNKE